MNFFQYDILAGYGSGGHYFLFFNKKANKAEMVKANPSSHEVAAPDASRAMLKLDNGTMIYLDSARNGSLAAQGNVDILKTGDGQIVYDASSKVPSTGGNLREAYNTLSNPRGSKVVSLTLSDGTRIWLNSESSLRYPATFVGNERKVEISIIIIYKFIFIFT